MMDAKVIDDKQVDAALVLWRFGLGAQKTGLSALGDDAKDLLLEEIAEKSVLQPAGPKLHSSRRLLLDLAAYNDQVKREREAEAQKPAMDGKADMAPEKSAQMMQPPMMAPSQPQAGMQQTATFKKTPYLPQEILLAEVDARYNGTIHTPLIGFGERLTMFFANHFAIATAKGSDVHILAGAFEREAIRPYIYGNFEDMLVAVETHPAMLFFLDNHQSVGPQSKAGQSGKRGLNENLAREIMELHTLGVDGGYSQQDVTAFARVITGWTVPRDVKKPDEYGLFQFNAYMHEPGEQTIMGQTYGEDGVGQGRAVLADLARHPATAHHLAYKLARYFIADQPSPALVQRMAAAYSASHGNLSAVYRAMLSADEAWDPRLTKLRLPQDYLIALLRSTGLTLKPEQVVTMLAQLGQPVWNPAGPNGFSEVSDGYASSEGLAKRIEVANLIAHQAGNALDPRQFAATGFGPLLSGATKEAIARASTQPQGLSLAFLSPEFQRR